VSSPYNGFFIRPVGRECSDTLTAIHRECFAHYWNVDAFNDFFSVSGTCALLAEIDGEAGRIPAAMGVHRAQYEQADIITLAVLPAYRRHGLGRALLYAAIRDATLKGAQRMFLDVEEGNEAALRLYQGNGFDIVNRRRQYYRQKDGSYTDALVMTRNL
jgi:ribosomal-protein-alanine N-acetyltransferase